MQAAKEIVTALGHGGMSVLRGCRSRRYSSPAVAVVLIQNEDVIE